MKRSADGFEEPLPDLLAVCSVCNKAQMQEQEHLQTTRYRTFTRSRQESTSKDHDEENGVAMTVYVSSLVHCYAKSRMRFEL